MSFSKLPCADSKGGREQEGCVQNGRGGFRRLLLTTRKGRLSSPIIHPLENAPTFLLPLISITVVRAAVGAMKDNEPQTVVCFSHGATTRLAASVQLRRWLPLPPPPPVSLAAQ